MLWRVSWSKTAMIPRGDADVSQVSEGGDRVKCGFEYKIDSEAFAGKMT